MFKNQNQQEDFKKKRQQYSITIRRNNREQILNKRRNIIQTIPSSDFNINDSNGIVDLHYAEDIKKFHQEIFNQDQFQQYALQLNSNDILVKHRAVIALRNIVDSDNKQLINKMVTNQGLLRTVINLMKQVQYPQLKLEAIWIIANVTYGVDVCKTLFQNGVIQICLKIIEENHNYFVDHAIVAIGNITAEHARFRDAILKLGGLQIMFKIYNSSTKQSSFQNSIWAITNLCRGNPPPNYQRVQSAIPVICRSLSSNFFSKIQNINISRVISDVLWTLANFSKDSKAKCDRIIAQGIMPLLFNYALQQNGNLYFPAVQILGNFASKGEKQTQALIDNDIFSLCYKLLDHPKKSVRRQTCWMLSNIAAGVANQVNSFLSRTDLLDKIHSLFLNQQSDVKRQICWIYPNLGYLGNKQQIIKLYQHYDIMKIYVNLLEQKDVDCLQNFISALHKILLIGNKKLVNGVNIMLVKFMEYQGIEKISDLQEHQSNKIYKAAVGIMTKFFQVQ